MEFGRKKAVVGTCLDTFVSQGLTDTSSRDLSKALELQSGGLYYYFGSKDEAVLACAEEAAVRLEDRLITPVFRDLGNPDRMMDLLKSRADEMAPTMKFLAQVCSIPRYREKMEPALIRLCNRYEHYAEMFAEKLNCSVNEILPYVYVCITAVSNYMIFGETAYIEPQIELVKNELYKLINKNVI